MSSSTQRAWSATHSASIGRHVVDAHGVLYGDRGDHRQRMAAHARERQDVGLQTGAAARIGGGKDENDGRQIGHA